MLCYRDITFCAAYGKTCGNGDCPRAFTEAERAKARQWWGKEGAAPVAFSDLSEGCPDWVPLEQARAG